MFSYTSPNPCECSMALSSLFSISSLVLYIGKSNKLKHVCATGKNCVPPFTGWMMNLRDFIPWIGTRSLPVRKTANEENNIVFNTFVYYHCYYLIDYVVIFLMNKLTLAWILCQTHRHITKQYIWYIHLCYRLLKTKQMKIFWNISRNQVLCYLFVLSFHEIRCVFLSFLSYKLVLPK